MATTITGTLSTNRSGLSAYEEAVKAGYEGTEEEWLASLSGESAYDAAVEGGYEGTEEEFQTALSKISEIANTETPTINGVEVAGDLTSSDLKLVGENTYEELFNIDGEEVMSGIGSERFNDYTYNYPTGDYSHAEGLGTVATGQYSHSQNHKTVASGYAANATGSNTKASGDYSTANGYYSMALGDNSTAIGKTTVASGDGSFASGRYLMATATGAHAEGVGERLEIKISGSANGDYYTITSGVPTQDLNGLTIGYNDKYAIIKNYDSETATFNTTVTLSASTLNSATAYVHIYGATGIASHSEGYNTLATLDGSHAEGLGTVSNSRYQHVEGKYNELDTDGSKVHIVGNGTSEDNRSNAHTLDWNGNAWFAGTVNDSEGKLATEAYVDKYGEQVVYVNFIGESTSLTADKTVAEVKELVDAGKSVFAKLYNAICPLIVISDYDEAIYCAYIDGGFLSITHQNASGEQAFDKLSYVAFTGSYDDLIVNDPYATYDVVFAVSYRNGSMRYVKGDFDVLRDKYMSSIPINAIVISEDEDDDALYRGNPWRTFIEGDYIDYDESKLSFYVYAEQSYRKDTYGSSFDESYVRSCREIFIPNPSMNLTAPAYSCNRNLKVEGDEIVRSFTSLAYYVSKELDNDWEQLSVISDARDN